MYEFWLLFDGVPDFLTAAPTILPLLPDLPALSDILPHHILSHPLLNQNHYTHLTQPFLHLDTVPALLSIDRSPIFPAYGYL